MNAYSHRRLQLEPLESRRLLAAEITFTGSGENVVLPNIHLDNVAKVDICGCGDNVVTLDAQWVSESGVDGTVKVVSDRGDHINFTDTGWKFSAAQAEGEQIIREFRNKDAVLNLVGPDDFTNPVNVYDVNGSGDVTSLDVLVVINELSTRRFSDPDSATIGDVATMPLGQFSFYDVSCNNKITSLDALRVINHLAVKSNTDGAVAYAAADAVLPLQLLASAPVVVAEQVSSTETSTGVDRTEAGLIDSDFSLPNDGSVPRIQSGQQLATHTTDGASSLSESVVDSLMLDPTLESCLEPELCLG